MNRYRVMLVDDEEDVAQAILKKMDWEQMGFETPRYAHNGLEALELSEELRPDIVMTDIKMPYMDGMELSRNLKKLYPNIRIIFFSGFDDFEYAKEAIRLEAEEYILKPIDAEELKGVFGRVHDALDRDIDEKLNVAKLENYYMDSLPLLQEDFFASLVEGRIEEKKNEKYLADYRIELSSAFYITAIVHISASSVPEGMNPVLLSVSVRKLMEERMNEKWGCRFFPYLGSTVIIAQVQETQDARAFTDDCDRLCRLAESICKANVTIGVGSLVESLSDIDVSYRGALDAVSYRVLYGHTKAINISEISPMEKENPQEESADNLESIFKKIKMSDTQAVEVAAEKFIKDSLNGQSSIQNYRFFVMELVSELYKFVKNNQLDPGSVFDMTSDVYAKLQQMEQKELSDWFVEACVKMHKLIEDKRSDNTRSFVAKARDYVADHYADQDLSIDFICNYLGVSSAYFSTVFKKETGKTFVGYLTDYRMEIAERMLLNTDEKTYIIAQEVGYSDPNYFSYVFKKQFGVSPSRYKAGKEV
ncbi:MAG: response regulator [Lachnospiraceae bacterium]|nr:response regulator [Lachnospiraceae bacterium]